MSSVEDQRSAVEIVAQFLRNVWKDNTEEEAKALWRRQVQSPDWAEKVLASLDEVVRNPPENLTELLEEEGWIILSHEPDAYTVVPYTHEEYREWLRAMTEEFRQIYQQAEA